MTGGCDTMKAWDWNRGQSMLLRAPSNGYLTNLTLTLEWAVDEWYVVVKDYNFSNPGCAVMIVLLLILRPRIKSRPCSSRDDAVR
ncbi:hypothetical protein OEZ85_001867 [Tetradesmus obliquus]|uniref:Uncharacterized protein n=1 Tax=Tetradesmus obliquus TaxID=3088 RepID=A0ABY8U1U6_TETOB|nr:hypothetical protein OEZ85_001867 [Tetradesmus obliquus]